MLIAEVMEARNGPHATGAFVVAIAGGIVAGYVFGRFDERNALNLDDLPSVWTVVLGGIISSLSIAARTATGSYRTILFGAGGGFFLTMYVFLLKAVRAGRIPPPRPERAEYSPARPRSRGRLWSFVAAGVVGFGVLVGASEKDVSTGFGGAVLAAGAVAVVGAVVWLLRRLFGGGSAGRTGGGRRVL